jgi:hypothetical protein
MAVTSNLWKCSSGREGRMEEVFCDFFVRMRRSCESVLLVLSWGSLGLFRGIIFFKSNLSRDEKRNNSKGSQAWIEQTFLAATSNVTPGNTHTFLSLLLVVFKNWTVARITIIVREHRWCVVIISCLEASAGSKITRTIPRRFVLESSKMWRSRNDLTRHNVSGKRVAVKGLRSLFDTPMLGSSLQHQRHSVTALQPSTFSTTSVPKQNYHDCLSTVPK